MTRYRLETSWKLAIKGTILKDFDERTSSPMIIAKRSTYHLDPSEATRKSLSALRWPS